MLLLSSSPEYTGTSFLGYSLSFYHQGRHRSLNQLYSCDFEDESRKKETKSKSFWVESRIKMVTDYKCWKAKIQVGYSAAKEKGSQKQKVSAQRTMKTDECESQRNISKRKESPSENSASPLINNKKYIF